MPIYEFECGRCEEHFEELVSGPAAAVACPRCGSTEVRRLLSPVSPPGRQPRGPRVRSDESRRREREATRRERLAAARRRRGGAG